MEKYLLDTSALYPLVLQLREKFWNTQLFSQFLNRHSMKLETLFGKNIGEVGSETLL